MEWSGMDVRCEMERGLGKSGFCWWGCVCQVRLLLLHGRSDRVARVDVRGEGSVRGWSISIAH